jgi:hypothetical protein
MMSLRLQTKVDGATTLGALASVTHPRMTMFLSSAAACVAPLIPATATRAADRAILSLVMLHSSVGRECNMRARFAPVGLACPAFWAHFATSATPRPYLRDNRALAVGA